MSTQIQDLSYFENYCSLYDYKETVEYDYYNCKEMTRESYDDIENLTIVDRENNEQVIDFPKNLKKLNIDYKQIHIPKGLRLLEIYQYNKQIFPESLEYLFVNTSEIKIENFPSNLKYLKFYRQYNFPLDNLPDSLEVLILPLDYNLPILKFPKNLKFLGIKRKYNHVLENLPDSLETLHIIGHYNKQIKFPSNLKHLYIHSRKFKQKLNLSNTIETCIINDI